VLMLNRPCGLLIRLYATKRGRRPLIGVASRVCHSTPQCSSRRCPVCSCWIRRRTWQLVVAIAAFLVLATFNVLNYLKPSG
jgi:hypothetical protein